MTQEQFDKVWKLIEGKRAEGVIYNENGQRECFVTLTAGDFDNSFKLNATHHNFEDFELVWIDNPKSNIAIKLQNLPSKWFAMFDLWNVDGNGICD